MWGVYFFQLLWRICQKKTGLWHLLLTHIVIVQQLNTSALCKGQLAALIQSKLVETHLGLLARGHLGKRNSLKKEAVGMF